MSDKINPCGVCGADHLALTLKCPPPSKDYERGRADGYAEAKEQAAGIACWGRQNDDSRNNVALMIEEAIRGMAPATTKEP